MLSVVLGFCFILGTSATYTYTNSTTTTTLDLNATHTITIPGALNINPTTLPASIISADPCGATTLAIDACAVQNCNANVSGNIQLLSGLAQITLSPSRWEVNYNLVAADIPDLFDTPTYPSCNNASASLWTFTGSAGCDLYTLGPVPSNTSLASKVCTQNLVGWVPNVTIETFASDMTSTVTDPASLAYGHVVATAGVEKLPWQSHSCGTGETPASPASASQIYTGTAVATAVVEVVKVFVPVGAVVVGAGLLV